MRYISGHTNKQAVKHFSITAVMYRMVFQLNSCFLDISLIDLGLTQELHIGL